MFKLEDANEDLATMKLIVPFALSFAFLGCDSSATDSDGGLLDLGADAADAAVGECEMPRPLDCVDEMILDLSLHDDKVSTGLILNDASGSDWLSVIDATAGGFGQENNNPWIYVRFEETGAVRVDIDDETALQNMDWHLAARRFVIRLNGGSTGPGCVAASALPNGDYVAITEVPEDTIFGEDDFFTEECVMLDDDSGLPNSPRTAMRDWWVYDGCVKTTRIPYLIQLDGERVIKLLVEAYYETGQEACNANSIPGSNGGAFTWRWRFLN